MFLRCLGGFLVDTWNYLGSQSAFSGVFTHFLAQSRSESRAHDLDGVWTGYGRGMISTTKTPKNGQKKYPKCPKQVGMDSQDLPGVVLCPSSRHDVEILLFF